MNQKNIQQSVSDVLSQLANVKPGGNGWTARCPAHDDQHNSLSIGEGIDGKILLNCHAGCKFDQIIERLPLNSKVSRRIVAEYNYVDENGELLAQVVRYEPKDFRQRRPDGNDGWIWNLQGVRRVLYNLPQLITDDTQATVFICAGEKDADRLSGLGLIATTNISGEGDGKWRDEYNEYLRGRNVVILADNDEPGRNHAMQVAHSLYGTAASIKIIELPGLPEKGDVSDFLNAGGTVKQLLEIMDNTDFYEPSSLTSSKSYHRNESMIRRPIPVLSDKALYGLAGKFVETILPHTESDKGALLLQMMVGFGNIIGRSAHFVVEATRHYTNLYAMIVGNTSAAKGSSIKQVLNILNRLDETWAEKCVRSGLSSGEGLIEAIGENDRRLFVKESEFASVLARQSRDSNVLNSVLRELWDDGSSNVMNRKFNAVTTSNAHLSLVGHITPEELGKRLNVTDLVNGYANRFLFAYVRSSKELPDGGNLPEHEMYELVGYFETARRFAQDIGEMKRDEAANKLWRAVYSRLVEDKAGTFGKVVARGRAQILRLSCLYALLSCSSVVKRVHLEAALALWQYCEDSAAYIFEHNAIGTKAQKLLDELLRASPNGLNVTEQNALFNRNLKSGELDKIHAELESANLAHGVATKGSKEVVWYANVATMNDFDDVADEYNSNSRNNRMDFAEEFQRIVNECKSTGFSNMPPGRFAVPEAPKLNEPSMPQFADLN
jgi:hypothetical protein